MKHERIQFGNHFHWQSIGTVNFKGIPKKPYLWIKNGIHATMFIFGQSKGLFSIPLQWLLHSPNVKYKMTFSKKGKNISHNFLVFGIDWNGIWELCSFLSYSQIRAKFAIYNFCSSILQNIYMYQKLKIRTKFKFFLSLALLPLLLPTFSHYQFEWLNGFMHVRFGISSANDHYELVRNTLQIVVHIICICFYIS